MEKGQWYIADTTNGVQAWGYDKPKNYTTFYRRPAIFAEILEYLQDDETAICFIKDGDPALEEIEKEYGIIY